MLHYPAAPVSAADDGDPAPRDRAPLLTRYLARIGYTGPVAPTHEVLAALLKADIDAGLLQATPVVSPPLERTLALCTSAHIPLSAAAQAVAQQAMAVAGELCRSGAWPGTGLVAQLGPHR